MKRSILFLAVFIILSSLISCDNSDTPDTVLVPAPVPAPIPDSPNVIIVTTFYAELNGANELTPNNSTATGNAVLKFNDSTKIFTLEVTYIGLTPSYGYIYIGKENAEGPIVFPLTNLIPSITYTSIPLSAAQEADLFDQLYYINLHSTAFPQGEIRGQLLGDFWGY